jgi:hypothetical protein
MEEPQILYLKKLFSLNSSVMDDNYDTYKTANTEIIQYLLYRLTVI